MADQPINALAEGAAGRFIAKAAAMRKLPDGSGSFTATVPTPKRAAPPQRNAQFQHANPATNAGRVPRPTGQGERQLDGTRTQTFDPPQKRPGLADREPAPARSSGGSGLEAAMAAEADRLHPPRRRS